MVINSTPIVRRGESASVILTSFVSDTDEEGQPTNPSQLGLEIVDVQPGEAFETILVGHTLSVSAVDEDYVGTASVTVVPQMAIKPPKQKW